MAREQAAAAQRARKGLWGAEESEIEFYDTLPAMDETTGLNLMWGTYEVTLTASVDQPVRVHWVDPGRESFLSAEEMTIPAGKWEEVTARFTLSGAVEHLQLACDLQGGVLHEVVVRKTSALPVSADLLAYACLAGIVLTWLLVLSWQASAQRRRDALILAGTVFFSCMPLLWDGLQVGHDLIFHLNRIEGIAQALRLGQVPVRIHSSTFVGYGYAASEFYPELFLYFPAVLRNLGVSVLDSLRIFEMMK